MADIKGTLLKVGARPTERNFLKRIDIAKAVLADADRMVIESPKLVSNLQHKRLTRAKRGVEEAIWQLDQDL